jgi:tetratricopeptide (TPR) repeat protein
VLAVYLAACLGAIQLLDVFINRFGLPDWFFPAAIALLIIGLPMIVATAVLQAPDRTRSPKEVLPGYESNQLLEDDAHAAHDPVRPHVGGRHWLTWRRALIGGASAFGVLILAAGGYLGLRAAGIGPIGSLMAKGVIKQSDKVLIADFHSSAADTAWAQALTVAFRIDFAQTRAVTMVEPERVRPVLRMMQKPADARLDAALAREVAMRAGISAVVTGDIARVGNGYVISAQLVTPDSGTVLAAYRAQARDSTELLQAMDKLSKQLRGKIGESLRYIRANDNLEQVTTPSLEALRKYSMGIRASDGGNYDRAITLLRDAISRDTTFAMAHRKLAALLWNVRAPTSEWLEASGKAYQFRERLTERERYKTEALYFAHRSQFAKEIDAYKRLLEDYPNDPLALNNLGLRYLYDRDYPRAIEGFKKALAADSMSIGGYENLVQSQINIGDTASAQRTMATMRRRFPGNAVLGTNLMYWFSSHMQYDSARTAADSMRARYTDGRTQMRTAEFMARLEAVQGHLAKARVETERAAKAAQNIDSPADGLSVLVWYAQLQAVVRNDHRAALAGVADALERFPLDSMAAQDRPYTDLAETYAAAGDGARAKRALQSYEKEAPPEARALDPGARQRVVATIALAERRGGDALPAFRAADQGWCSICMLPWIAQAFDAMGRPDSATVFYERYVNGQDYVRLLLGDAYSLAPSYERLGDLYAATDKQKAAHYYNAFITLWKSADPELQPRVQAARRRLEALALDRSR